MPRVKNEEEQKEDQSVNLTYHQTWGQAFLRQLALWDRRFFTREIEDRKLEYIKKAEEEDQLVNLTYHRMSE